MLETEQPPVASPAASTEGSPWTVDWTRDLTAGLVVFLVALPLCLGVALASGAPLIAGVLAGIIGGVLVGALSGSHTSVSGPAAGLTAVVAAEIQGLGSFENFLLAVALAGLIQIGLGVARAGFLASFIPSSVIKGLLAAIGVILILKQIPHVLGHDDDPEGDMAFVQVDRESTFSELAQLLNGIHPGAALIGGLSIALLVLWDRVPRLKKSPVPSPLLVVLLGVGLRMLLQRLGGRWDIGASHLVQVPVAESLSGFARFLQHPNWSQWANPAIYTAALTIAAVASIETLLNLEAIDRIDPRQRVSPPSRELVAQGVGNLVAGLIGGLPVTSVIVRSSVNLNAGARSKASAIGHGVLLLVSVFWLPTWLNLIPLSCLAAILLVTGIKLASPKLLQQMWREGRYQFIPFLITVVAIVLTDLLIGIGIGLAVSVAFILNGNVRRPVRQFVEKHLGGEVLHIELANQVSYLNRAALLKVLEGVPRGGQVLLDAQNTDYIDPDILSLLHDFAEHAAPARGVAVSFVGFRDRYQFQDQIQYVDYSTRELQDRISPAQVLQILKDGNERFRTGQRLTRDPSRVLSATAAAQHPMAVVLSCIDSRAPAELIFDVGLGDIVVVRIAGSVAREKVMGSVEYACTLAGAKLIVVLGHTRCGAVTAAVTGLTPGERDPMEASCPHLGIILQEIQQSIPPAEREHLGRLAPDLRLSFVDALAERNVRHTVAAIPQQCPTLATLIQTGRVGIVGAMYDVGTGALTFLDQPDAAAAGSAPPLAAPG